MKRSSMRLQDFIVHLEFNFFQAMSQFPLSVSAYQRTKSFIILFIFIDLFIYLCELTFTKKELYS